MRVEWRVMSFSLFGAGLCPSPGFVRSGSTLGKVKGAPPGSPSEAPPSACEESKPRARRDAATPTGALLHFQSIGGFPTEETLV